MFVFVICLLQFQTYSLWSRYIYSAGQETGKKSSIWLIIYDGKNHAADVGQKHYQEEGFYRIFLGRTTTNCMKNKIFSLQQQFKPTRSKKRLRLLLLLVLFSVCTGKLAGRREAEHGGAKAASTVAVLVFSRCQTSDCATRISHMSNIILVFGDTFFLSPRHRGKSMNWTR